MGVGCLFISEQFILSLPGVLFCFVFFKAKLLSIPPLKVAFYTDQKEKQVADVYSDDIVRMDLWICLLTRI